MKVVIQRVKEAFVEVEEEKIGQIEKGFLLLVGVSTEDNEEDVAYLARKIANLRIFEDEAGKMNLPLTESGGSILSVSQFTLLANTKKGNRPSFIEAAEPEKGEKFYQELNEQLRRMGLCVQNGKFGADMKVHLVNDGPVTIILDSKNK